MTFAGDDDTHFAEKNDHERAVPKIGFIPKLQIYI
jgi:hypothetical protein